MRALASYLEALHAAGLAGADHTTLLLSCYARSRDVAKLDAFVSGAIGGAPAGGGGGGGAAAGGAAAGKGAAAAAAAGAAAGGDGGAASQAPAQLPFDAETAFKTLRAAGYPDHALAVAARAQRAEWRLEVLLDDARRYDDAIAFIGAALRRCGAWGPWMGALTSACGQRRIPFASKTLASATAPTPSLSLSKSTNQQRRSRARAAPRCCSASAARSPTRAQRARRGC